MNLISAARFLVVFGLIVSAIGGLLYVAARLGLTLEHLPGNIRIERQNFTCVIALGASIVLSIVVTVLLNVIARLLTK